METNSEIRNNSKVKKNGYSNRVRLAKLNQRRTEADERQLAHDALSIAEKIAKAKSRRGNSTREIARLEKQLAKSNKV